MLELLMKRRSIRKYKPTAIEQEKIDKLVRAALLSPSSRRINPWEFIVVTDKEVITKLAVAKEHGSSFLNGAPLAIVVVADETKTDVWVEDTSIAGIIIQLAAEDMGLGSCWIQIRKRMHNAERTSEEYVRGLLDMPENIKVASIIAIGYPDEKPESHSEAELMFEKVFINKHGKCYRRDKDG
ncbi:nitroreductase family protein [Phosphitispora sp. TUW77]|uniref:nitroreductase family protein n=1 Tax=Phosphitispora sp. TUW77 TaxID=3152361 RepID=UPI003AB82202